MKQVKEYELVTASTSMKHIMIKVFELLALYMAI